MAEKNSTFSVIAKVKADLSEWKKAMKELMDEFNGKTTGANKIQPQNPNITPGTTMPNVTVPGGTTPIIVPTNVVDMPGKITPKNSKPEKDKPKDTNPADIEDKANMNPLKRKLLELKESILGTNNTVETTGKGFTEMFGKKMPDSIGKSKDALDKLMGMLKTMFTLYAGKKIFDFTLGQGMQFETFKAGFESIYKGDEKRASEKMKQLEEFAKTTPYELPEVVEAGLTLEGGGLDSQRWLKTAGNLASFNKAKGSTIGYTSQILKNAMTGNYGMAVQELREQGISETELMKQGVRFNNRGEVRSDLKTFMKAIEKAVDNVAGNQMDKQSQTVPGMISNIQDSLSGFGRMISSEFYEKFRDAIEGVMSLLDKMGNNGTLKTLARLFAQALTPIVEGFKNLVEWINKATQTGQMASIFAGIGTAIQGIGFVIEGVIGAFRTFFNLISQIGSVIGGLTGSSKGLSQALWTVASALIAIKTQAVVLTFFSTLQKAFRGLLVIYEVVKGVKSLDLAIKALMSSNVVGLIMTIASALLFMVLQMDGVKQALGSFLEKIGAGKMAEFLGLKEGSSNADDLFNQNYDNLNNQVVTADPIDIKVPEQDQTDWDRYADKGKDLENQFRTATDDLDIAIRKRELTNETSLQKLELKGNYKDSKTYSDTEESGQRALYQQYIDGVSKMKDIIAKAGDNIESRATKMQAENKLLEYQQKANEILLQIENNTAEFKNTVQLIDTRANKLQLEKDIKMQETEIGGTRQETYAYWLQNRQWLKQQLSQYQQAYEKVKSIIPSLNGQGKLDAEIKALEYQKKANEILLQIRKNTDPRNGTFNLPDGVKPWTLFDERQSQGKTGVMVSGNSFLIQVKELVDQKNLQDLFNKMEETIYESLSQDVRR